MQRVNLSVVLLQWNPRSCHQRFAGRAGLCRCTDVEFNSVSGNKVVGGNICPLTAPLRNFAAVDQLIGITISPDTGVGESRQALILLMEYEFAEYKSKSLNM